MAAFVAGVVVGLLGVFIFVAYNATRPQRLIPLLVHSFQVARLHLGRNTLVAGITSAHGWHIEVNCFGCRHVTAIRRDATEFVCMHCNRPFKDTGNEEGGAGVNVIDVSTRK